MFGFGSRNAARGMIINPRSQQPLAPEVTDPNAGIIRQPADEYPAPPAAAAAAPAPAPAPVPEPPAPAPSLSYTGSSYKGYDLYVLYHMDNDQPPVLFESVLERWKALPASMKFAPLDIEHYVYCVDNAGNVHGDIEPPEGTSNDAMQEHEQKVAVCMAELTGKKPEPAPAKVDLAATLSGMNKNALRDLFGEMDKKDLFRLFDAARDVKNRIIAEEKAARAAASAEEDTPPEEEPAPAPQPQPARQPQPQRRQATPQPARNLYSGW